MVEREYIPVSKALPEKSCVVLVKIKNYLGEICETRALYDSNVKQFYRFGSQSNSVVEWKYRD